MNAVNEFNGLNGVVITREAIQKRIAIAMEQEQFEVSERLKKILIAYPDDQEFKFEIEKPAVEVAPQSLLHCLDCELHEDSQEGLGKAVAPDDIYQSITDMILAMLDKDFDFEQEWGSDESGYFYAYNFVSQKPYRGINQIILGSKKVFDPTEPLLQNPYFLTFQQIKDLKGSLRKGAKGHMVVYFIRLFKYEQDSPKLEFGTYDEQRFVKWASDNKARINVLNGANAIPSDSFIKQSVTPILKYYNVFNGNDVTGIDFDLDNFKLKGKVERVSQHSETIEAAEDIILSYPAPAPTVKFGGNRAFFRPSDDLVQMPHIEQFKYIQAYYTTFFHELIHSTGSEKRLDREKGGKFGDKVYAFEELIAELGAVFLCAESGILHYTIRNSAAYLKSWREALREEMQNDNRFFFRASSQAQKAVDFMISEKKERIPAKIDPEPREDKPAKKPKAKTSKIEPKEIEVKEEIIVDEPKEESLPKPVKKVKNKKDNAQLALWGVKNSSQAPVGSLAYKRSLPKEQYEDYIIADPEIAEFLGNVEKKKRESVVITLAGGQGSMKTRMLFRAMNAFAQNYKCGHASIEEHPDSKLYNAKVDQYLDARAQTNISNPEINSIAALQKLIEENEIVFIDSFAKVQEMDKGFEVDKDLRKKYDGKLFVIIFQQTTDGKMRGGSKSQFDGDIILLTEVFPDYKHNYIYANKNRYQDKPLHELKFNIFRGELERSEADKIEESTDNEPVKLSFDVIEN